MTIAEERSREHMQQVRAVHRRSAHARIVARIGWIERLAVEADARLRPSLQQWQLAELKRLRNAREDLERQLIAAGQTI